MLQADCKIFHSILKRCFLIESITFAGGPVIVEESNSFEGQPRFVLMGTVHGSFLDCSNDIPGIFVATDNIGVLEFLYKESFGSGVWQILLRLYLYYNMVKIYIPKYDKSKTKQTMYFGQKLYSQNVFLEKKNIFWSTLLAKSRKEKESGFCQIPWSHQLDGTIKHN